MNRAFLAQTTLATPDRVHSASTEDGITTAEPVADTANAGALGLRSSGTPTAATAVDIALQAGGLPMGFSTVETGIPGAAVRYRMDGDADDEWRGFVDRGFLTYCRQITVGTNTADAPYASPVRTLANGDAAFAFVVRLASSASITFAHKANRTDTWTLAVAAAGVRDDVRPDFCVLPDGRILLFYSDNTTSYVHVRTSTDNGANWSTWSTSTRVAAGSPGATLGVEYANDTILLVVGATPTSGTRTRTINWSSDSGMSFSQGESTVTQGMIATAVTSNGVFLLGANDTSTGDVSTYTLRPGGGIGEAQGALGTTDATNPVFGMCAGDDGTVWALVGTIQDLTASPVAFPAGFLVLWVSADDGVTWVRPNGAVGNNAVYDNKRAAITSSVQSDGFHNLSLGSWRGALLMIGVTNSSAAATDDGLQEIHYGVPGGDSLTEAFTADGTTLTSTTYYNRETYTPTDLPENLSWTRTDTGAGAAVTLTANGLNIVGTAGNNTKYTTHSQMWSPGTGDCFRFRFLFRVTTCANFGDACLFISASDGTNRQWIRLEFKTNALRLVDQSGTVVTSTVVSNQFTVFTELLIAFAHDSGVSGTGSGLASIWYRTAGATFWTELCSNQTIAEQAGTATEQVFFGGNAAAGDVDWDVTLLGIAEGSAQLEQGFTNPDDLNGFALDPSVDRHFVNGMRLGGYGGPGVVGDLYTLTPRYHFGARNLWLSPRPSCRWQSSADDQDDNIVLGDSSNTFRIDTAVLLGTNMVSAKLELNSTNSWGSPAVTLAMSAIVWEGAVSASFVGGIRVDGTPFRPHRFRSRPGQRWFLLVNSTTYEIDDNERDEIHVRDLPSGLSGTAKIFGDRMGGVLPSPVSYAYARIVVPSSPTADGKYRIGTPFLGVRHEPEIPWEHGFVESWLPNVRSYTTVAGHSTRAVLGAQRHQIRLAWPLIDRISTDYLRRLVDFLRSIDGAPVVVWRNTADVSALGLYWFDGPATTENAFGIDEWNDFSRLAECRFTAEPNG
jgi:hypothetical protein